VQALVGHTQRIARGDYSVRNTSYREDELGRLSEAFDQMARGLDERDRVRDLLDKNVSPRSPPSFSATAPPSAAKNARSPSSSPISAASPPSASNSPLPSSSPSSTATSTA